MSSLAEVLGQMNGAVTTMPPEALHLWLPGLKTPTGWVDATAAATAPVARMLVRRAGVAGPWDACELLNLYRVPGLISTDTVLDNADVPTAIDGLLAVRVSGHLAVGSRAVEAVYNYYAINTPVGAALIEQAAVVGADAPAALVVEVECLAESVYESLLISLHSAVPAPSAAPSGLAATGDALAGTTQAGHLTTSATVENRPQTVNPGTADAAEKALGLAGGVAGLRR